MGLDRAYDAMLQLRDELVRDSEATGRAVTEIRFTSVVHHYQQPRHDERYRSAV